MAHVMEMKDGKTAVVFGFRDVLEIIGEYAGEEPRRFMEEYLSEKEQDRVDFEKQEKYYEGRLEKQGDRQRALLNDLNRNFLETGTSQLRILKKALNISHIKAL